MTITYWVGFIVLAILWIVAVAGSLFFWFDEPDHYRAQPARVALQILAAGLAIPVWPVGLPIVAFIWGRMLVCRLLADIRTEEE